MTSAERKQLEILEKRVEMLVQQQERILLHLNALITTMRSMPSDPRCTVCDLPMHRVDMDSVHGKTWVCKVCGESQVVA